jgi:hypothetical protein
MPTLEVGTAIEARFGGDEDYFAGRVETINGDGTYGVLYADGDSEGQVARDMIRVVQNTSQDGDGGDNDNDDAILEQVLLAEEQNSRQMKQQMQKLQTENARLRQANETQATKLRETGNLANQQKREASQARARARGLQHELNEMNVIQANQAARLTSYRREIEILQKSASRCRLVHGPHSFPSNQTEYQSPREIQYLLRPSATEEHEPPWH